MQATPKQREGRAAAGLHLLPGGRVRHLIGYAAANLDAATWIGQDSEEGRLRLATALDYLARAADVSALKTPAQ